MDLAIPALTVPLVVEIFSPVALAAPVLVPEAVLSVLAAALGRVDEDAVEPDDDWRDAHSLDEPE